MKTVFTFLIIVFLFAFKTGIASEFPDHEIFEKKFNVILSDLDSVITNSKNQHQLFVKHYEFVKDKIIRKELKIVYDTTLNNNFNGCASFNIANEDSRDVGLYYSSFLIEKYEKFPALIYAIIIHTFQSAYDYYNNHDLFVISMTNPIEKTYFEMDALTVEALFLSVYMKNYPDLGYFERYLMADLENKMLSSACLFNRTDIRLLHKIDNLKSEDKSAPKLLKEFEKIGKNLIKEASFDSESRWENYCELIKLRTYVYYSQQVLFDIMHSKEGIPMNDFDINEYPENQEIIREIQGLIGENKSWFSYQKETIEMFDKFY